ncbi:MAG: hypothetical protein AAFS06_13885 [Cyanobacteria bacterium J06631_12]
MMQTVKGIYRNGKVELLESPQNVVEGEVLVTFLEFEDMEASSDTNSSHIRDFISLAQDSSSNGILSVMLGINSAA